MKRKTTTSEIQLSKRKKQDEDEEVVFSSKLKSKSFKKLKDNLGDSSLGTSKEEVSKMIYNEALPYLNLPRDIKLNILDYIQLVVSEDDIKSIEKYEEKRKIKYKTSKSDINYIKYFYGYFYDSTTPFIVFKNIYLDFYLQNHLKFEDLFYKIIPFTNCSVGGREILQKNLRRKDKKYFIEEYDTIMKKFVKDQCYNTSQPLTIAPENIGFLKHSYTILEKLNNEKLDNVYMIKLLQAMNYDHLLNMINPNKIKKFSCRDIDEKTVSFLLQCPNIQEIECWTFQSKFIEYLSQSNVQTIYFFNSSPNPKSNLERAQVMKRVKNVCYSFSLTHYKKRDLTFIKEELDVSNLESFSIFFETLTLTQQSVTDLFDYCLKQNSSIKLITDRQLNEKYLRSNPTVSVEKVKNFIPF